MADQTLDQLPEQLVAQDADLLYAVRNGADIKVKRGVLVNGLVPSTRTVVGANGLKGGGALTGDVTLELDVNALAEDLSPNSAADYAVTFDASDNLPKKVRLDRLPGSSGGTQSMSFANIAVNGQSTVVADSASDTLTLVNGANIAISTNATADEITIAATNVVPATRNISAGSGLTGGGALSADRQLALNINGQSEDLAPDLSNDFVITYDSSSATHRKVRLSLLSGTAYTPPLATTSTLGVIRVGSGLSIDTSGVLSANFSYTPPIATINTTGVVRVGNGLSVDSNGLLSNNNPTPYTPTIATAGTVGVIKGGPGVNIAQDGTLTVEASSGGVSDGAYRPEGYGAIRGTGLNSTQRQANVTAINACWAAAGTAKGRVDMGAGTFEVQGTLTIPNSSFVITGDWCTIRQFGTNVSIVAASSVSQVTFKGFNLTYQTNQTSGDNPTTVDTYVAALRLSAVSGCNFEDIDISGAWVGVGVSASTGSFNNTYTNIRTSMTTGNGYGLVHKAGTGSAFINFRVTGNGTSATVQGGAYLANMNQSHFTQLTVEWLLCRRPVWMSACQSITYSGTVFHALTPTAVGGYGGVIHVSNSTGAQFAGSVVSNIALNNSTQAITDASIYCGELGANILVTNLWVSNTIKTGTVRFALMGHISSSAARNVTGTFQQVRLDTRADNPHRIDDLCYTTVDPLSDSLDGPLLSYNSTFGGATGGYVALGDESATIYTAVHGRHVRVDTPLTAARTITLSQYIDKPYANATLNAPRTYRGATMRIERTTASTGSSLITVVNHNGTSITTLASASRADFIFDGTNWVLQVGQASGGSGGGTFATQTEAEAGLSSTTYMSPVRTKDAIVSYAASNEIAGTEGQVVGFNTAGDAVIVKNTRTMIVPLIADATAVSTGTGVRNLRMPLGLKLSAVELYTPTTGTTATTVDINLNGSSIFTSPPTITANGNSVNHTVFATATLVKGGIVTFDIDAAGTGAKGLQVTLIGVEV